MNTNEDGAIVPAPDHASIDDWRIIEALRAGDDQVFAALVARYHPAMVRLAVAYAGDAAEAEAIAWDIWQRVLQELSQFDGHASLTTWLFRILLDRARAGAQQSGRAAPFSIPPTEEGESVIDPERFLPAEHRWAGHWATPPRVWSSDPDGSVDIPRDRDRIGAVVASLPPGQQIVITLRDIEGWSSAEVCNVCQISETDQRVLLHRARSRVRRELERDIDERRTPV
jgi:RNA polymerase sigma-70 factor (ECF subfamily)